MAGDGRMKTPREKYQNDPMYRALVDTFEAHLHRAQFTPSEIREAAMLACINYEMRQPRRYYAMPDDYTDIISDGGMDPRK